VQGEYSPMDAAQYAEWMGDLYEGELEGFLAYIKHQGEFTEDTLENFREAYQGEHRSDEDFAQSLADDLGLIPDDASWPNNYIDWERAARDLMYDYFSEDGHYFRAI